MAEKHNPALIPCRHIPCREINAVFCPQGNLFIFQPYIRRRSLYFLCGIINHTALSHINKNDKEQITQSQPDKNCVNHSSCLYPVREYPVVCHEVIFYLRTRGSNTSCKFSNGIYFHNSITDGLHRFYGILYNTNSRSGG